VQVSARAGPRPRHPGRRVLPPPPGHRHASQVHGGASPGRARGGLGARAALRALRPGRAARGGAAPLAADAGGGRPAGRGGAVRALHSGRAPAARGAALGRL
ncbi:MAG: Uncharacterized membrane protein YdzA, partial [uncultured Gemmatimonadetes bacterium]